jgi:y4mF family transcriptional regulator
MTSITLTYYTRKGINYGIFKILYPKRYKKLAKSFFIPYKVYMTKELILLIKDKRRELKLTQQDLADRAGVGLRFIRELEQGKETLRMDKVNQVLALFGFKLIPGRMEHASG